MADYEAVKYIEGRAGRGSGGLARVGTLLRAQGGATKGELQENEEEERLPPKPPRGEKPERRGRLPRIHRAV